MLSYDLVAIGLNFLILVQGERKARGEISQNFCMMYGDHLPRLPIKRVKLFGEWGGYVVDRRQSSEYYSVGQLGFEPSCYGNPNAIIEGSNE